MKNRCGYQDRFQSQNLEKKRDFFLLLLFSKVRFFGHNISFMSNIKLIGRRFESVIKNICFYSKNKMPIPLSLIITEFRPYDGAILKLNTSFEGCAYIPAEADGTLFQSIEAQACYSGKLTEIDLSDTKIRTIGNSAFCLCLWFFH